MTGIVILDYNNASDTINCVESVMRHTTKEEYKLMIVENGSNEETVTTITEYVSNKFANDSAVVGDNATTEILPFVTLLVSNSNDGYARGNNKGLKLFDHDEQITHILILNNDILFIEDIVTPLQKACETIPQCGIVSALLTKEDGITIDYCCARKDYYMSQIFFEYLFAFVDVFHLISKRERSRSILKNNPELAEENHFEIELPSGSCMLIKKDIFRKIGYFDEGTFLYFEENILYRKINKLGLKNYLCPQLKCIHLGASTSKKIPSSFIMKCQKDSAAYYLRNYRYARFLAKWVDVMWYLEAFKLYIQNKIRK